MKRGAFAPPVVHCLNSRKFQLLSLPVQPELRFKCVLRKHPSLGHGPNPHRFSDLAAEHVDPEDLGIVVALGEGEAVALWRAIVSSHTEQDLIDGVVGDLRTGVGVQQPVRKKWCQ